MNPLNIHHIKFEKANSIKLRYQKLRKVTSLFRAFEIFILLAIVSRLSLQVPIAIGIIFKLFQNYFQCLSHLLVSPQFVFIVGNVIVITLFVNSGNSKTPCEVKLPKSPPHEEKITPPLPIEQGVTEETTVMTTTFSCPPLGNHRKVAKVYHRSKSERPRREKTNSGCSTLRRSNTEVIKSLQVKRGCCGEVEEGNYPEDHMSNEEFRKTIEDFIAKQQRFLREEEEFSGLDSNFDL